MYGWFQGAAAVPVGTPAGENDDVMSCPSRNALNVPG